MNTSNDPYATQRSQINPNRGGSSISEQPSRPTEMANHASVASKWIHDTEEEYDTDEVGLVPHNRGYKLKNWAVSDSQFGGNKLRAPRTLASEEEFAKGGKKRTAVKRRRRRVEDEISDDDEDGPYANINIEEILSPIESPLDIVYRPALKRIIKSPQIEELSETAMEFIESEKNFNKILSRLSAILHSDDPQYLDLNFERTPRQRKLHKLKMERKAAKALLNQNKKADGEDAVIRDVQDNGSVHVKEENESGEPPLDTKIEQDERIVLNNKDTTDNKNQKSNSATLHPEPHSDEHKTPVKPNASDAIEPGRERQNTAEETSPKPMAPHSSQDHPKENTQNKGEPQIDQHTNKATVQKRNEAAVSQATENSKEQPKSVDGEPERSTDQISLEITKKRNFDAMDTEDNLEQEILQMPESEIEEEFTGPDHAALEVVRTVRELLLENINFSNEYLSRLQAARDKLTKAYMQKDALWKQLKINAKKDKDRRRVAR